MVVAGVRNCRRDSVRRRVREKSLVGGVGAGV